MTGLTSAEQRRHQYLNLSYLQSNRNIFSSKKYFDLKYFPGSVQRVAAIQGFAGDLLGVESPPLLSPLPRLGFLR